MRRLAFLVALLALVAPAALAQVGQWGPAAIPAAPYVFTMPNQFDAGPNARPNGHYPSDWIWWKNGTVPMSALLGQLTNAQLAPGAAAQSLGYTPLAPAANLSDLASPASARTNLGLGPLAPAAPSGWVFGNGSGAPTGNPTIPGSAVTIAPPGGFSLDLQKRALNQISVGDYGVSFSSNTYNVSGGALAAGATALTATAATDFAVNQGLLIPGGGDAPSFIAAPTIAAVAINGPMIRANGPICATASGNGSTAGNRAACSAGQIATKAIIVAAPLPAISGNPNVYDLTTGKLLGTFGSAATGGNFTASQSAFTLTVTAAPAGAATLGVGAQITLGTTAGCYVASLGTGTGGTGTYTLSCSKVVASTLMTASPVLDLQSAAAFDGRGLNDMIAIASGSQYGPTIAANGAWTNGVSTTITMKFNVSTAPPITQALADGATISVVDTSNANCAVGTVSAWTGLTLTLTSAAGCGSSGSTDALAFTVAGYSYEIAGLDAPHTDANGGVSGGGVGLRSASASTGSISVFLGSQTFVLLTISNPAAGGAASGVAGSQALSAAFSAAVDNTLTLAASACPNGLMTGQSITDTTLPDAPVIGRVASCAISGGHAVVTLQSLAFRTSSGAADAITFTTGYAIYRTSGPAGCASAACYYFAIASRDPASIDTGYCFWGTCPVPAAHTPNNVYAAGNNGTFATPPAAAADDWAVRTVTSASGTAVNFAPATVNAAAASPLTVKHDETAALNLAISANLTTGGVIRLPCPEGGNTHAFLRYNISGPIVVPGHGNAPIAIDGDGFCANIDAAGVSDTFDFGPGGAVGSNLYGLRIKGLQSENNTFNHLLGLAIYAQNVNNRARIEQLRFADPGGITLVDPNGVTLADILLSLTVERVGFTGRSTSTANDGILHIDNIYAAGNENSTWPDMASDGAGYLFDGSFATTDCRACQSENIGGDGVLLMNSIGNSSGPFGLHLNFMTSEFITGRGLEILQGHDKLHVVNSVIRGSGFNNFITCALSSNVLLSQTSDGNNFSITGSILEAASGDGVYSDFKSAAISDNNIQTNSAQNGNLPAVGGPIGTSGVCSGVHLGPRSSVNVVSGNTIGVANANQAYPVQIDAGGAPSNSVGVNAFDPRGQVAGQNFVHDQSGVATIHCNGGASPADCPLTGSWTVATLPACGAGNVGQTAYVTDAAAPTYNSALTGGSTVTTLALCNGSGWTAH